MQLWTVYKEFSEEAETQPDWAEYYQVQLFDRDSGEDGGFIVSEVHGWWNEEEKRNEHHGVTLDPEEPITSLEEAFKVARNQIMHRIRGGFVHLLVQDTYGPNKFIHLLIDPDDKSTWRALP